MALERRGPLERSRYSWVVILEWISEGRDERLWTGLILLVIGIIRGVFVKTSIKHWFCKLLS